MCDVLAGYGLVRTAIIACTCWNLCLGPSLVLKCAPAKGTMEWVLNQFFWCSPLAAERLLAIWHCTGTLFGRDFPPPAVAVGLCYKTTMGCWAFTNRMCVVVFGAFRRRSARLAHIFQFLNTPRMILSSFHPITQGTLLGKERRVSCYPNNPYTPKS